MSEHTSGAYTGEIAADMLASVNATGAIIGHSERRQYHGETDSHCNRKVKLALDNGLVPIYCNGETLEQRKSGQHFEVIKTRLRLRFSLFQQKKLKSCNRLRTSLGYWNRRNCFTRAGAGNSCSYPFAYCC